MNALIGWLLSTIVTTSALAVIVLGAARFIRNQPALQHVLWLVVLLRFVCPPVVAISVPEWIVPLSGRFVAPIEAPADGTPSSSEERAILPDSAPGESIPSTISSMSSSEEFGQELELLTANRDKGGLNWKKDQAAIGRSAACLWFAGSLVAAVFQASRILRLKRRIRSAMPAPMFLTEVVEVGAAQLRTRSIPALVLSGINIPLVWCFGKTRLLWPEMLAGDEDIERCRGAILHELAHVRRRDHWIAWVDLIAGIVWWWNPVFQLVRRRLHESAELACDALALSLQESNRREYAELFLELSLHRVQALPPGLGLCSGSRKLFERRLTMMLSDLVRPSIPLRGWALTTALALAAVPAWSISRATDRAANVETDRTEARAEVVDPDQRQATGTKTEPESPDPSRDDQKRLQGTWDIVGFVHNDEQTRNSFKRYQLTFKEGEVTTDWIREDDETGGGTSRFSVDATRKPRELLMEGENLRIQAIYRFEKDHLTIAFFGKPERTRPQGFTVKDAGDSGDPKLPLIVWKLKRGAPGVAPDVDADSAGSATGPAGHESDTQRTDSTGSDQEDADQADRMQLQGTWDIVGHVRADRELSRSFKLHQLTFDGNRVMTHTIRWDGRHHVANGKFSLDATSNPRKIRLQAEYLPIIGIYHFHGDELTIAFFSRSHKLRPQGFTVADAGDSGDPNHPLMLWRLRRGTPAAIPEDGATSDSASDSSADDVTARFLYPDTMLLLSSDAGVAAVVFTEAIAEERRQGIRYEYRYESRDGSKKLSGEAELFETRDREGTLVGKLYYIEAGDIRVRWSVADTDKGWIYYSPEKLRVQLANAKDFRARTQRRFPDNIEEIIPAIDLSRFQLSKPASN